MKLFNYLKNKKTYIIAEMSANHSGSFKHAIEIVHAAKEAGADCLKTQTYTADTLTINCNNDYFIVKGGLWDGYSLYDLYKNAFTPWDWQPKIKEECDKIGLDFLSTPFDKTAVDLLEEMNVGAYKIASPELIDIPLIKYVASKGKPMLVSCGMGNEQEIEDATNAMKSQNLEKYILLKCCSEYPSDYSNMNLSLITDMKNKFKCDIGLSDHSMGSLGAVTAVTLGARVIEKHFCISREDKSADSKFSMNFMEFKEMVKDIRNVELILGQPVYGPSEGERRGLRNRRSLFAVREIRKGEILTEQNIKSIRPGQGLLPKDYDKVIGKKAKEDISLGTPLNWSLIED
jgi:pseudaminic acid synthase